MQQIAKHADASSPMSVALISSAEILCAFVEQRTAQGGLTPGEREMVLAYQTRLNTLTEQMLGATVMPTLPVTGRAGSLNISTFRRLSLAVSSGRNHWRLIGCAIAVLVRNAYMFRNAVVGGHAYGYYYLIPLILTVDIMTLMGAGVLRSVGRPTPWFDDFLKNLESVLLPNVTTLPIQTS